MRMKPKAHVYVDGFNLYRRCLESHPEVKWLDLVALCQHVMPDYEVTFVRYFTALLRQGLTTDLQTPVRQQMYLRALGTDPKVSIHFGTFRNDKRMMPVHPATVDPKTGKFVMTAVRKLEEKGSDVNLATRMMADAFQKRADIYVMLSNDSDQVGPLQMMKEELGYSTGIIFPMPSSRGSKALTKTNPDFIGHVTLDALKASQFPEVMVDAKGRSFSRPPKWDTNSEGPS